MVINTKIFGHAIRALTNSVATSVPSLEDFRWDCQRQKLRYFGARGGTKILLQKQNR